MGFISRVELKAAEESKYVIKKDSKFWTGKGWNDEYPEVKIFKKEKEAVKERDTVLKGQGDVYKDYGYEHEEIVAYVK
jgi:hypothetical protein